MKVGEDLCRCTESDACRLPSFSEPKGSLTASVCGRLTVLVVVPPTCLALRAYCGTSATPSGIKWGESAHLPLRPASQDAAPQTNPSNRSFVLWHKACLCRPMARQTARSVQNGHAVRHADERGAPAQRFAAGAQPFIRQLHGDGEPSIADLAFEFLVLTAARTNEVLEARWSEIDLEQAAWTVPRSRMKAGREHRVPLAPLCIELLGLAKVLSAGSDFVFPGRSNEKPMSNMVLLMTMRRMKSAYTVHGFRSAFRDWASERTNFAREICEAALAHIVKDKTEAAYRRGDLFEKRRELMATWAAFVAATDAAVIPLRRLHK